MINCFCINSQVGNILINDKSVSVNILSEDNYNAYANIDLSKSYSIKSVIRDLEKKNYTCK